MTYTQIKNEIGITDAAISKHLSTLLNEKIIQFEKIGREKHYRLSEKIPVDFERQAALFSSRYTARLIFSNPDFVIKGSSDLIDEISNSVGAFFLFTILISIKTGKNWFKAFDAESMFYPSVDLLSRGLFGKIDADELHDYLSEGPEAFFAKVSKLSQNRKNEPMIDKLFNALEEKFPDESKLLKEFFNEYSLDKKN